MNSKKPVYLKQKTHIESFISYLKLDKKNNKPKQINKKLDTAVFVICWGPEFFSALKFFFLKHIRNELCQKYRKKTEIVIATDEEYLQKIKKELKKFKGISVKIQTFNSVVNDTSLDNFQKYGIIFQNLLIQEINNLWRKKIILLNPDQMFTKGLFEKIYEEKQDYFCGITAPIRCNFESWILKNRARQINADNALQCMHKIQKCLTVFENNRFVNTTAELASDPWGFGFWIHQTYFFKVMMYVLCYIDLSCLRKKGKIILRKVSPDIGFLEQFNLKESEINWMTNLNEGFSMDVSLGNREHKCYIGSGKLLKLMAKRFCFYKAGSINHMCYKKIFFIGKKLSSKSQKTLRNIILQHFYFSLKEKTQTVIKAIYNKNCQKRIREFKNYDEELLFCRDS